MMAAVGEEMEVEYFDKKEYIQTRSGNKISRKSVLGGSHNIKMNGMGIVRPGVILRGDLAKVSLGKFNLLHDNVVVRPSHKPYKKGIAFSPLSMGDYVMIQDEAIVEASSIGSHVFIGKGAVIGKRCVIHDCCCIEDFAVVPDDSVLPPFSRVGDCGGSAASSSAFSALSPLPESWPELFESHVESAYASFQPRPKR